jgi:gamma-glutamyltranspeptidase/glutathione hydrolase
MSLGPFAHRRSTILRGRICRLTAFISALVCVTAEQPAIAQFGFVPPETQSGWSEKPLTKAARHMVAAANPLAVAAGRDILRAGGSAVDAAIAVQLVLGLVEPQSSGLGGGAFLMHWDAVTGSVASYDGRETAPAAARPDRFIVQGRPLPFRTAVQSALSIGVPGTVRLLEHVHRRHGKLPWAALFQPARQLADAGFPVSPRLVRQLTAAGPGRFEGDARAYFFDADGKPRPVGYRLANPAYAQTLARIAADGAGAFYSGEIAARIIDAARVEPAVKGAITGADLAGYRVIERPPLCIGYRRHRVCVMGPPSSAGHAIGQVLALVEPFDLGIGPAAAMNPGALHVLSEALKLAFADRNWYLADPEFTQIPGGLLDPGYIASRRRLIAPHRPLDRAYPGRPPAASREARGADDVDEGNGTSHISIIDGGGNALAMTTTIESGFGSGRWAAGFLLNNELTDFSFQPADSNGRPIANRVQGGKRPRSSMAPAIVFGPDDRPRLVTGSAGGARIIAYTLKVITGVVDWRLDPASAMALPNFGFRGGAFELEQPAVSGVQALGHPAGAMGVLAGALGLKPHGQTIVLDVLTSGTHTIVRRADGGLEGAADPRREGVALGD